MAFAHYITRGLRSPSHIVSIDKSRGTIGNKTVKHN